MNALQTVSELTATLLTRPANASLYTFNFNFNFNFNENIDNYSDCAKRGNPFIDNKDLIIQYVQDNAKIMRGLNIEQIPLAPHIYKRIGCRRKQKPFKIIVFVRSCDKALIAHLTFTAKYYLPALQRQLVVHLHVRPDIVTTKQLDKCSLAFK